MSKKASVLLLLLLAAALLAGIGIGHELWRPAARPIAQVRPYGGSGFGGAGTLPYGYSQPHRYGSPYGYGLPYGQGSGGSSQGSGAGPAGPANLSSLAAAVDPSLVDINVTLANQGGQASATGIVLTSSGTVLTNNHVIAGATTIKATDVGNGHTYTATVVGYDRGDDLAVVQLAGASGLKTAALGDSSNLKVGDLIVAVGNAGGVGGTPSVAGGSIVALNRQIVAGDLTGAAEKLEGLIEVDANVQPGDSGGPLVSAAGRVVGINTAASGGFSLRSGGGQGYAIPIDRAQAIAAQIEAGHSSATVHVGKTALLGVELASASSRAAVVKVLSGSPASRAGLSAGDLITGLAGKSISSPSALISALSLYHPGDRVQLSWRDTSQRQHTATVILSAGPAA